MPEAVSQNSEHGLDRDSAFNSLPIDQVEIIVWGCSKPASGFRIVKCGPIVCYFLTIVLFLAAGTGKCLYFHKAWVYAENGGKL